MEFSIVHNSYHILSLFAAMLCLEWIYSDMIFALLVCVVDGTETGVDSKNKTAKEVNLWIASVENCKLDMCLYSVMVSTSSII